MIVFALAGLFSILVMGGVAWELFTNYPYIKAHWQGAAGLFSMAGVCAILLIGFACELWENIKPSEYSVEHVCSCGQKHD
jgi:hypothetical protein